MKSRDRNSRSESRRRQPADRLGADILPLPWVARRRRRPVPARAYESRDPDDYEVSNRALLGVALFLVFLIGGSIWLLETMHANTRLEECLMQGRRNCTPVVAPLVDR